MFLNEIKKKLFLTNFLYFRNFILNFFSSFELCSSTDTEDYMQIPLATPQTVGIDPPRPPPPPPPLAPTVTLSNGDTQTKISNSSNTNTNTNSSKNSNIPQPPQPPQDTATRKQQQPLSAISIQDLNSVQVN